MPGCLHRSLPAGLAFLDGPQSPDDLCFPSDRLHIRWTDADTLWTDHGPHLHRDSDGAYIVLQGAIVLDIEAEQPLILVLDPLFDLSVTI